MTKMTKDEQQYLADMAAFCLFGIEHDMDFRMVLATLGHDVGGLINREACFSPRSTGYAKAVAAITKAKRKEK